MPLLRQKTSLFEPRRVSLAGSTIEPSRPSWNRGLSTFSGKQSQPASGQGSGFFEGIDSMTSTKGQPGCKMTLKPHVVRNSLAGLGGHQSDGRHRPTGHVERKVLRRCGPIRYFLGRRQVRFDDLVGPVGPGMAPCKMRPGSCAPGRHRNARRDIGRSHTSSPCRSVPVPTLVDERGHTPRLGSSRTRKYSFSRTSRLSASAGARCSTFSSTGTYVRYPRGGTSRAMN